MKSLRVFGWSLMLVAVACPAAGPFDSKGFPGNSPQFPLLQAGPPRDAASPAPQRVSSEIGRGHMMSADERRQLRRDIQDAGKDIYRPARQERGDPRRSGR